MKKRDRAIFLLRLGYCPREVAQQTPCSLSWAYTLRGRLEVIALKHHVAAIREELAQMWEALRQPESRSAEGTKRERRSDKAP